MQKFFIDNAKMITGIFIFLVGLYVQHEMNTQRIDELEVQYKQIDSRMDQQYQKIDAIKLDKSVFEATVKQFSTMSDDIREIGKFSIEVQKSEGF